MSDDEVDELLKAVDTSNGEINYTGMCSSTAIIAKGACGKLTGMIVDLVRTILAN